MTLPTFAVIGAAKAGTTALYWYLDEHPQIAMSPLKETNFFAYGTDEHGRLLYGDPDLHRFPVRSIEEYEGLFPSDGRHRAIGEASPIYIECPQAAERIATTVPEMRIICGLREPVDRAYSDYLMYLRSRGLRFDPDRDLTPSAAWARPDSHWMRIGRYHEMLTPYFERFPHDRIHVFLFDDFTRSPAGVAADIYAFVGADPGFSPDLDTPHNVGGVPANMLVERLLTNKAVRRVVEPLVPTGAVNAIRRFRTRNLQKPPPMPPALHEELQAPFLDDIRKTSDLIGQSLDRWTLSIVSREGGAASTP